MTLQNKHVRVKANGQTGELAGLEGTVTLDYGDGVIFLTVPEEDAPFMLTIEDVEVV